MALVNNKQIMRSMRLRCEICFRLLLNINMHRHYCVGNFDFLERTVQIHTCGDLYKEWRKERVFWKLPKSDLTFDVKFIDTRPTISSEKKSKEVPTVLALHGAPGSWKDYTLITSFLHKLEYRVIAPTFPDFHVYKPGVFRHTDLEKSQYIKDFLAAISVSHIDLLICHSSAVYPGLNLCLSNEPRIKSLALLNPGGYNVKGMRATKQFNFLKAFVKVSENPVGLKFLQSFGPFVLKNIVKTPVKFENILDPLLSATCMLYGNITKAKQKFLLVSKKMPILYIFSENDALISTKPSYEVVKLIGACDSDIFKYDNTGLLVQKGKAKPMLKVLAFQEGSHYAFLKYPEIVNKELADFLPTDFQQILTT